MKIRNLVLGMIACAAFTACTNENDVIDNKGGNDKLKGEAYVAIKIVTPSISGTRAGDGFEAGTGDESKVTSATFLFFDAAGDPCANQTVTGAQLEPWTKPGTGSVEQISTPVLLLNPVNGAIPASVIAILNATTASNYTAKTLAQIKADIKDAEAYKPDFIMTNSVYGKNNGNVVEVPLTIDNLATTAELAEKNPVRIPVERVVAKVELNKNNISESSAQTIKVDGKEVSVKAVIKGWKVTATNPNSYLLKSIDANSFNTTFPSWNWNDEANVRSYWATSAVPTAYGFYTYDNAVSNNANTSEYCLENTSASSTKLPNYSTATKLWVVAQLVNATDNKPLSFMEWRGSKATPDGVKALMANMLKKYYYVSAGTVNTPGVKYTTIAPADLKFVAGSVHYKAKAALASDAKKFYTLTTNSDNTTTATEATANLTAEVNKLPEALAWTDGMTYYYTNIQHAGTTESPIFGVVRNHVYKLKLTSISGLGTPVYSPDEVIDPTKPAPEDASYVAAEVEVLKWKVVEQNVDLN